MKYKSDEPIPEFEQLNPDSIKKLLESENAQENIEGYMNKLIDTTNKTMRRDLDDALRVIDHSKKPKEKLIPFNQDDLIPAPSYSQYSKKTTPTPPPAAPKSDIKESPPLVDSTADKAPKRPEFRTRTPDFTPPKKETQQPVIKSVPKPKKRTKKAKGSKEPGVLKAVDSQGPKTKKVDAESMEKRFKDRQQKIQDIFDKDKGNVS